MIARIYEYKNSSFLHQIHKSSKFKEIPLSQSDDKEIFQYLPVKSID